MKQQTSDYMPVAAVVLTLLITVAIVVTAALPGQCEPTVSLCPLTELREVDERGVPIQVDQIVTIEGIALVDTGKWHNAANYFAIVNRVSGSGAEAGPDGEAGVLVYLPGSCVPEVRAGDLVRVTGRVSVRGYTTDYGTTVIIPARSEDIVVLEPQHAAVRAMAGVLICTDPVFREAEPLEGRLATVEGRLSRYDNEGITRGFWVDGSRDGDIEDGKGRMQVKFYDYAGIDVSHLREGSYVVVTGVLVQGDDTPPHHDSYYIRPTLQEYILSDESRARELSPEELAAAGMSFQTGLPVHLQDKGIFQLTTVTSGTARPFLSQLYPDWSPDGSAMLFVLGKLKSARTSEENASSNLFTVSFTGAMEYKQLTFDRELMAYPRWSPDGKACAYAALPDPDSLEGNWDISIWDMQAGSSPRHLTTKPSNETCPCWSPDGSSLIYQSDAFGSWDLFATAADGSGESVRLTSSEADEACPDWCKGGSMIAYQSDCGGASFDIWVARLDTTGDAWRLVDERCLTSELAGDCVAPRWSPDGAKIAFASNQAGTWDIWMVDAATGALTRVTDLDCDERHPAWSKDGRRIIFGADLGAGAGANVYAADVRRATRNGVSFVPRPELQAQPKAQIQIQVQAQPEAQAQPRPVPGAQATILRDIRIDPASDSLTFAILADIHLNNAQSRGSGGTGELNAHLMTALDELNALKPDFVILLGDLVESSADTYARDYEAIREIIDTRAEFPVLAVVGNHDGQRVGSTDGFKYWQDIFGPMYYSFDIGLWHFAMVNTYDYPDNPSDNGVCGKEQLAWLEQDLLAASLAGKRLAVFGHHNPMDDRWVFMDDGREDLARIMDRNGVRYVFAGHRHSDQLELTETTRVITTRTVQAAPSDLVGYRLVRVVNGRVASWRAAPPKASDSL